MAKLSDTVIYITPGGSGK